jgi:hypothetical protein
VETVLGQQALVDPEIVEVVEVDGAVELPDSVEDARRRWRAFLVRSEPVSVEDPRFTSAQ